MAPVNTSTKQVQEDVTESSIAAMLNVNEYITLCERCSDMQVQRYLDYCLGYVSLARAASVSTEKSGGVPTFLGVTGDTAELPEPSPQSSVSVGKESVSDSQCSSASRGKGSNAGSWKPSRRVKDGFCYSKIINCHNYKTVTQQLGTWPSVEKILSLSADKFEVYRVISKFTILPSWDDKFHVSAGGRGSSLIDEFITVAHQCSFPEGSYGHHLSTYDLPDGNFMPIVSRYARLGGGVVPATDWRSVFKSSDAVYSVRADFSKQPRMPLRVDPTWGDYVRASYLVLLRKIDATLNQYVGFNDSLACVSFQQVEGLLVQPCIGLDGDQQAQSMVAVLSIITRFIDVWLINTDVAASVSILDGLVEKHQTGGLTTSKTLSKVINVFVSSFKEAVGDFSVNQNYTVEPTELSENSGGVFMQFSGYDPGDNTVSKKVGMRAIR